MSWSGLSGPVLLVRSGPRSVSDGSVSELRNSTVYLLVWEPPGLRTVQWNRDPNFNFKPTLKYDLKWKSFYSILNKDMEWLKSPFINKIFMFAQSTMTDFSTTRIGRHAYDITFCLWFSIYDNLKSFKKWMTFCYLIWPENDSWLWPFSI